MKTHSKTEDFLKIYRNCTNEPSSFLTIDNTLPANNPMRFRNNFSDSTLKNDTN